MAYELVFVTFQDASSGGSTDVVRKDSVERAAREGLVPDALALLHHVIDRALQGRPDDVLEGPTVG